MASPLDIQPTASTQPPPLPSALPPPLPGGSPVGTAAGNLADKLQRDLGVGVIWLVVLSAIARATDPVHGYEIARSLSAAAPEGFSVKHGTLYPILRTMETEGLVTSTLVASTEGPARKCFRLTTAGTATLVAWVHAWQQTQQWVNFTLGEPR